MKKMIGFLLASLLVVAASASAEEVYVQSLKVKLMAGPSFKDKVVTEVKKGHKFTVLSRRGTWVKVRSEAGQGFVSSLLVSAKPPMAMVGLVKAEDGEIKDSVRRRASTYTSAAAARGLAADDRRRLSAEEKVNYDALADIESIKISDADLAKFIGETR